MKPRNGVAKAKNGGVYDNGTLLCPLTDLEIFAVFITVNEILLRYDSSVK